MLIEGIGTSLLPGAFCSTSTLPLLSVDVVAVFVAAALGENIASIFEKDK